MGVDFSSPKPMARLNDPLPQQHLEDADVVGAERHPDAEFLAPLVDRKGNHAVDPDRGAFDAPQGGTVPARSQV